MLRSKTSLSRLRQVRYSYRKIVSYPFRLANRINNIHRVNLTRTQSLNNDIITTSYYVGKYVTAFIFFYTSLNYFYYKRLREQHEEDNQTNNNKKNK